MAVTHLDDESTEIAQDIVDILGCPYTRSRHCLDQVCTSEQGNFGFLRALRSIKGSADCVDFVLKVIEHLCCLEVVFVKSLPWVHCSITVRYSMSGIHHGFQNIPLIQLLCSTARLHMLILCSALTRPLFLYASPTALMYAPTTSKFVLKRA
jgi:hypothetical protein